MGGGGGVWNAHLSKNHGGEGVKIKKNHWARGQSNIEKHGAGGGGGLPGIFCGHVVLCDLNSGTYQNCAILVRTRIVQFWYVPELCNSGTYQNSLLHVAILERTRIVQFRYVPESTILVHL